MSAIAETLSTQFGSSRTFTRVIGLVVLCSAFGYVLATHGISQKLFFILALFITIAFFSARYPWLAVVSPMLVFTVLGIGMSSGFSIAGVDINMADMLLLPAFAPTVVKVLAGRRDIPYPSVPAILTGSWIIMATALGLLYGNAFGLVRNELHVLLFIVLAYFWAVIELRSIRDIRLVYIALIAATALAGLKAVFISFFVGHSQEGVSMTWQAATMVSEQLGGQRTILNGADTMFVLAMPMLAALALFFRGRRNIMLMTAAFMLTLFGLLISLTRTNWATVIVCILLVMLIGARTAGARVVRIASAVALLAILGIFLSSFVTFGTDTYDLGELLQRRLEPNPYTGAGNLNYRIIESEALIEQASEHIVVGNGLGASFAFLEFRGDTSVNWAHNGHLWLLLKSGIIGIAMFYSAFLVVFCQLVRISLDGRCRIVKASSLGFAIALAALMIMSLLVNRISNMEGAYFLGLALALPQVIGRIESSAAGSEPHSVTQEENVE